MSALTFGKTRPQCPGWYWLYEPGKAPQAVHVVTFAGSGNLLWYWTIDGARQCTLAAEGAQWAGPMEAPGFAQPTGPGWWEYSNSQGQTLACSVVAEGGLLFVENENKIFPVANMRGTWRKI